MNPDLPIWQLTVGQFRELLKENAATEITEKKIVTGYQGLADFLGCGRSKVYELVASDEIKDATIRHGRKIMFDTEKVLEILKNNSDE